MRVLLGFLLFFISSLLTVSSHSCGVSTCGSDGYCCHSQCSNAHCVKNTSSCTGSCRCAGLGKSCASGECCNPGCYSSGCNNTGVCHDSCASKQCGQKRCDGYHKCCVSCDGVHRCIPWAQTCTSVCGAHQSCCCGSCHAGPCNMLCIHLP